LWNAFSRGEIELHIPYLCLQEALNNQLQKSKLPLAEIKEVHRYLSGSPGAEWDKDRVNRFFAGVADYLREEQTSGIRERLLDVWDQIKMRNGVIYPSKDVFDLMPLGVDDLRPNDHLILASVLHRAQVLRGHSATDSIYFCSKDGDLSPMVEKEERARIVQRRPVLIRLYEENGVEFISSFALPQIEHTQ
jgi:hypothetical protein